MLTFRALKSFLQGDMQFKYILILKVSTNYNLYSLYCRIYCEEKQSFLQDCEDDGETAAGGRLLHLLQVLCSMSTLLRSL